ncbi:phosphoribosylpyrophosphate synthetase [Mariniphaga sp.]|uniref:phosphoribosylpyrophosphate synthetase n=1 Tax=Mariniphaga sp. TaxID=1954475 RepID=UPI0035672AD1
MNNQYSTLSEAIEALKKEGYTTNFRVNDNGLLEANSEKTFGASEVKLAEFHRFEGMTDPGDSTILYALETSSGLKGTLADSYGADASELISEFMKKVERKNQIN